MMHPRFCCFPALLEQGACAELCAGGTLFIETRTTTVRGGGTMRIFNKEEHMSTYNSVLGVERLYLV